jgi:putative endonuclease
MRANRQDTGKQGEMLAQQFLRDKGYTLIETNFRCRTGEIDLIAKDGDIVVFIEVRTVTSPKFGPAYQSVTYRKQQQVKRVALFYAARHNLVNTQFRFDVIGITLNRKTGDHQIEHLPNAFQ